MGAAAPFTASSAALLEELKRVERGKTDRWVFESPEVCIKCKPRKVMLEDKPRTEWNREAVCIELPFKEALLFVRALAVRVCLAGTAKKRADCQVNGVCRRWSVI